MLVGFVQRSLLRQRPLLTVFAVGLLLGGNSQAYAYRPFDGTDAAVADPGEVEVELQPAGAQWSRVQNLLIAPAIVYNYGLTENWEAVLESQLNTPFAPSGPTTLSASGAFLKHILRPGVLQDKAVRVSPLNLAFFYPTAMGTADLAPALILSYRSGGIGGRLI